jgi:hypothetical protein
MTTPDATGPEPSSPVAGEVAPGVARNGTVDADRLADAHASALSDTSYTWVMTYREYENGTLVAAIDWHVVVEGPRHYAASITEEGANASVATAVERAAYADGETRYELDPDGRFTREQVDTDGRDPYLEAATWLISWYLSIEDVSVGQVGRADDGRHYVLAEGDTWPDTHEEHTVAVVRDYGLVDSLRRRHRVTGTNTTVVVEFEYRDIGATTVTEPAWVGNATDRTDPNRSRTASPLVRTTYRPSATR